VSTTAPVRAVVTVFNGASYVADAIRSLLDQDPRPAEIVAVDDGSSDATPEVLRGFGAAIRVITQPNQGVSNARNTGVDGTAQPYLGFCDADDLWAPDRLRSQLAALDAGADIVFGQVSEFAAVSEDHRNEPVRAPFELLPGWLPSAMLLHRDTFARVGPFDETLSGGEFFDWMDRARRAGLRILMLDQVVLYRRIHGRNTSATAAYRQGMLHTIKHLVDRRRTT
jgi:glycosyltransferase involved in cell wall biosynthesis